VSSLCAFGRKQDFALQKARETIGVRSTAKTWNLTTHQIDPYVDDARDTVMGDLIGTELTSLLVFSAGVGELVEGDPRKNLTGDPWARVRCSSPT
jgi:hypothetical protein